MNDNKLIKKEIIDTVSEKLSYSKKDVDIILNLIFDIMKESLLNEKTIEIRGFGTFFVKEMKEKKRFDFKSKKAVITKPSKKVIFKSGIDIIENLNK